MLRLFRFLGNAASTLAAAGEASAALRQHRMPDEAALARLGIPASDMRAVRF
ncbi:hypothetical protein [Pseudogemmobacter blasticus]|uniref:hypothetical protein n=1 Tax=Fuscovulum blasticum TaxID=1075 RepID=UPI0013E07834|nr:hypothetical protein [Fuscovulum blasticum]